MSLLIRPSVLGQGPNLTCLLPVAGTRGARRPRGCLGAWRPSCAVALWLLSLRGPQAPVASLGRGSTGPPTGDVMGLIGFHVLCTFLG